MWFGMAAASSDSAQMSLMWWFDGTSRLHESALAAMRAIEGDMSPSEIAEAIRRARSSATRTP